MTKILYVWQAAYPWDVRAEKICQELRVRGCDVTLLARWKPGQAAEEMLEGIRIVRTGHGLPHAASLPIPINPVWRRAIRELVQTWNPDVVIAREILLAEPAARACRRRGIPMIIDMAEHYPATMRTWDKYRDGWIPRLLVFHARVPDLVERRSVSRADGVISVCDEQNDRLHRQFGYPRNRMAVVHNTLESNTFDKVRKGCTVPPRVFAHHGYITSQRGLGNLVRGFALAARQEPEIELVLAGSGDTSKLSEMARDLRVADRIKLTGPYSHAELVDLYSQADVGMLAYPIDDSWSHTLPNKLFDYLACGKPVIVSPIPSFRRVVEDAKAGVVLAGQSPQDIADGILRMCRVDPEPMVQGGQAAARSRYNWESDAQELIEFLARYISIPSMSTTQTVPLAPGT